MGGKNWEEWENQVIRDHYYDALKGCYKRLPHRTILSIYAQAHRLGIKTKKAKDLTGQPYGDLIVEERGLDYISPKGKRCVQWWCRCACGKRVLVFVSNLQRGGDTKSCGHCNDIVIGKRYNDWLEPVKRVEDYVSPKGSRDPQYEFRCYYGAERCKGVFITRASSVKKKSTNSCGCLNREKAKERLTKENNPNWKNGISDFNIRVRGLSEIIQWKKDCRKRDNYMCQKCGSKESGKLPVHHRKSFHVICEENNINNSRGVEIGLEKARNCKELLDRRNGITLCTGCHKEFHHIYGKVDFTELDFKDFENGS